MKIKQRFLRPLRQLLVIFLAGILIIVSTACRSTNAANPFNSNGSTTPSTTGEGAYPRKQLREYSSESQAKSGELTREAERRLQKAQDKDYLDRVTPDKSVKKQAEDVGKSVKRAAENVKESTQQAAEKAAENTQQGLENLRPKNLKENTERMLEKGQRSIPESTNM